ncbi:MAG: NAD(P)H-binding protein [Gammaproteobacteria bacterium]
MPHLVTITGATGHVGKALAERLLQGGVKIRAVARSAKKLAPLTARGAEACVGDLQDTAFLTEAFRGADTVFAMIPSQPDVPDLQADQLRTATSVTEALKASGVPRVVALSSAGAGLPSGTGPIAGLHEFEELLKSVPGLSVVALRPTYFMENQLESIDLIKSAGINGSAARADVALAMIATRDIAAVTAEYLLAPTFDGYTVRELLGPRDYTHREATAILGAAIGKPDLAYVEFSDEDFRKGLLGAGFSASAADAYVEMYAAINDRRIQNTTSRNASNTTPTTLEEFAREVFAPACQAS